ncbi:MAG: Beta-hydroxyacyl-(acyl-carrier-protein) dehydratase FabA/FabZ, partial [Proteobacteria bacterium]|nr:Beta-hydroxyacyl-(acyl-carrier-protein) dehydratase FabA/FabZ [Pseudomonadota bacterium]
MSVWPSADPEPFNSRLKTFSIGELLPHSGNMILLDTLLDVGEDHIVTELAVRDDGLFSTADGTVPAWVGLEYMAQTVAAFSGYYRRLAGLEIELGFLLGTRHYECSVSAFPCGARLRVLAEKVMDGANDMSVFACLLE